MRSLMNRLKVSGPKNHSVEELESAIPDDEVKTAFMRREDIANLPEDEREYRWANHLTRLRKFMADLSSEDTTIVR